MSYQNLKYTNIAGEITATYNDNNMRIGGNITAPPGPGLVMLATAKQGLENRTFRTNATKDALVQLAQEFNAESDVLRLAAAAQQVVNQNVPVSMIRIGAKPFHFIIEKATKNIHEKEAWITITPYATMEEDTAADLQNTINNISLFLQPYREGSLVRQRVVLYGQTNDTVFYDSEGILIDAEADSIFDVDINVPTGQFLYTKSAFDANILNQLDLDSIYNLADLRFRYSTATALKLTGDTVNAGTESLEGWKTEIQIVDEFQLTKMSMEDYNTANPNEEFSLRSVTGSNGDFISYCERYAANELAYEELEFESISFLHCDKCHADVNPVGIDAGGMDLQRQLSWQNYDLGYMWKYVYNGRPHIFMSARKNPFDKANVIDSYLHNSIRFNMSETQQSVGDLLNLVTFYIRPGKVGDLTEVESFFNDRGYVECHIDFDPDMPSSVDSFGRNETAFEALGAFSGTGVDKYGRSQADWDNLVAFADTDNNGLDDVTNLTNLEHSAYIAAVPGWLEVNAESQNDAEYNEYRLKPHESVIKIETPFAELEFSTTRFDALDEAVVARLRPSYASGSRDLSQFLLTGNRDITLDPFLMNHFELTGNLIPEAVMNRLFTFSDPIYDGAGAVTQHSSIELVAKNREVREVSFLQQAAQAAYVASTNYSQTLAVVPVSAPPRSRNGISAWAGNPATYTIQSNGDVLVTKNGTGVLGTKLLAGAVDYRGGQAFGGVILTNGALLPNGIPYGVDDSDEALDALGNPIDIGKHAVVVGAYGLMTDPRYAFPRKKSNVSLLRSGPPYVGSAAPMIAGVLASLEPGTEPIGPIRGRLSGFNAQQRTPRSVLDDLAALRICMIDQTGVISSIYTAALRTSDYTKISSIVAANAILGRIRQECMAVIGSAYTDEEINSLASRLDGLGRSLIRIGYCQSISTQLKGSRLDRINGIVRLSVRFVPPLSIEAIEVDLTLEPPASGI